MGSYRISASERRMQILEVLCERRHDTRENLATEFGVSKRTIEYDIQTLMLNYPIYTTQGGGGGIHVVDGYRLGRKYINSKQAELLERLAESLTGEDLETMQSILKTFKEPRRGDK